MVVDHFETGAHLSDSPEMFLLLRIVGWMEKDSRRMSCRHCIDHSIDCYGGFGQSSCYRCLDRWCIPEVPRNYRSQKPWLQSHMIVGFHLENRLQRHYSRWTQARFEDTVRGLADNHYCCNYCRSSRQALMQPHFHNCRFETADLVLHNHCLDVFWVWIL